MTFIGNDHNLHLRHQDERLLVAPNKALQAVEHAATEHSSALLWPIRKEQEEEETKSKSQSSRPDSLSSQVSIISKSTNSRKSLSEPRTPSTGNQGRPPEDVPVSADAKYEMHIIY